MTRKPLLLPLLLLASLLSATVPAQDVVAPAAAVARRPVLSVCVFPTRSAFSVQAGQTWSVTVGTEYAAVMATYLKAQPAGTRTIYVNGGLDNVLYAQPDDQLPGGKLSLWHPSGIRKCLGMWDDYLRELRRLGGADVLDYVAFDGECAPSCFLSTYDAAALAADPRYAELVRTAGFPPTPPSGWPGPDHYQFNFAAAQQSNRETAWFGIVLRQYFPRAQYSNYMQSAVARTDAVAAPDGNANPLYLPGNPDSVDSPAWYCWVGNVRRNSATGVLAPMSGSPLTPYERLVLNVNSYYAATRANHAARVRPWDTSVPFSGMPRALLVELRLHAWVLTGQPLLHWQGNGLTPEQYADDDTVTDEAAAIYCRDFVGADGGNAWVLALGTDQLRSDKLVYLVSAARYKDGTVRGRVTWRDDVRAGQTVAVYVDKTVTVRVTRNGSEAGTSFVVMPDGTPVIVGAGGTR